MLKKCFACKKELDVALFGKNSGHKDGLQSLCFQCKNARERNKYAKLPDGSKSIYRIAKEIRIAKCRLFVMEWYKSQGGCQKCGEQRVACLQANHLDGYTKVMNVSIMCSKAKPIEEIAAELAKCECLCANCHACYTAECFGWYKNLELLE
jgi:hypothetical protein